ncbi:hypothetical protein [Methylobacterium oryzisoli]|uniref:hypothetical protein n=1 Tax=Methylobacterium oryzisoli TaxID=3385502 RepID=UPI003891703F
MRARPFLILAALLAAGPALAQTRAERRVDRLNDSMTQQNQLRSIQQQNRFETNQIRGEIRRSETMAPTPPPPAIIGRPR